MPLWFICPIVPLTLFRGFIDQLTSSLRNNFYETESAHCLETLIYLAASLMHILGCLIGTSNLSCLTEFQIHSLHCFTLPCFSSSQKWQLYWSSSLCLKLWGHPWLFSVSHTPYLIKPKLLSAIPSKSIQNLTTYHPEYLHPGLNHHHLSPG